MILFLLLKAYQPGLFDEQVTVSGHATKKGTYVQPYQAKRKKRLKDVVEGDMFADVAAPEPEPTKKEPWQMTQSEFSQDSERRYIEKRGGKVAARAADNVRYSAYRRHSKIIENAIAEGKAVPADVLADYPDLKPKEPEKKPEAAKGEATGLFSESEAPTPPKPPKPKKEPTPEQTQRQAEKKAEKKAEKEEDRAAATAYRKAKEIAGKAGEMSARGALGGQDSKTIGTLAHDGDTYRVSLVRNSGTGMVSVAITPKGEKRATITSVRDDQTLAHAMGALLAAVKPDAVLTLDDQDAIAAQKATAQQTRQQKEADAAMKAMRKYRASLGGSADPQPWDETDLKLHAKIAKTESYKYKSAHDERSLEINKARLKSDPSKWEAGQGVAWKVGRDQTNHGFRVKRIDAAAKMALITQVADTGLTTSGGNYDRMKDEWVDIADLRRERKYDAPTTTPPEKAAKGADKLDPGIDEHALKRLEKEAVDAKASVESERAALERLHASDNIPGVFQAGGSNYTMGKKREAMNSRLSTQFNKLQDAEQRLKNAESRLSGYRSGEYHENGQAKANSPKREAVKAATKTYADFIRATVKAGDRVTFLPNPSPGGDTIKKLNQKTVSLSGGSSWDYLDIHPWIDGNPATQKEVMAAFKRWKENADSEPTTKSFPMLRLFAKAATIAEPADELIREHERLVKVLRSPSHADDLKESDEQERELKEYRKKKRMKKALLVAPLTALLKAHVKGHTRHLTSGKVVTVSDYNNRVAKKAEPAPETEDGLPAGFTVKKEKPAWNEPETWLVRDPTGAPFAWPMNRNTREEAIDRARQRLAAQKKTAEQKNPKPGTEPIRLYHGTNDKSLKAISEGNIFGGLFASEDRDSAKSHNLGAGKVVSMDVREGDILTQNRIDKLPKAKAAIAAHIISENLSGATRAESAAIRDAVLNDKDNLDGISKERLAEILRWPQEAHNVSWGLQALRGKVAAGLGYKAVEMRDEHGTSYLVLHGTDIRDD